MGLETFTESGYFNVPPNVYQITIACIGGGGGGQAGYFTGTQIPLTPHIGRGGAKGNSNTSTVDVADGQIWVEVGAGGTGGTWPTGPSNGGNGQASVCYGVSAAGGIGMSWNFPGGEAATYGAGGDGGDLVNYGANPNGQPGSPGCVTITWTDPSSSSSS